MFRGLRIRASVLKSIKPYAADHATSNVDDSIRGNSKHSRPGHCAQHSDGKVPNYA